MRIGVSPAHEIGPSSRSERATLSVALTTAGPAGRVAALLEILRPLADEIIAAVDDRAEPSVAGALETVADRVILYPYAEPVDRPLPWLRAQCRGDWVFFLDDDEVPGQLLLDALPRLLSDVAVTHVHFPRRWLFPDSSRYLDDHPWRPDYQLRLVRNDARLIRFSAELHRPIIALGPGRFSDAMLWHVDALVRPYEARLAKARRYEKLRPGMRVAGRSQNYALGVPELSPEAPTAPVPDADQALIEAVLAAEDPVE